VRLCQIFDGLELHNDLAFDDEIQAMSTDNIAFVVDIDFAFGRADVPRLVNSMTSARR
jgi:hypothetical protein